MQITETLKEHKASINKAEEEQYQDERNWTIVLTCKSFWTIEERIGSGIHFLTFKISAREPPSMYSRAMLICPESGV